jgi:hypothetical protein
MALKISTCAFSRHARSEGNSDRDVFIHTGPQLLPVQIKRKNACFFTAKSLAGELA